MSSKYLFGSNNAGPANTNNEAGAKAYAFSAEHALAQYATTGTLHNTYYAKAESQLESVLELAERVSPEFVAKTALYARERGFMKDVPALLVAYLAQRDVATMKRIFPRVIDSGKMLRNFVQIVRSGQVGRKSFGTAPKRAMQAWFRTRTPETIFRHSLGADPTMSDVIKMVRPSPKNESGETDAVREALYGYLIGKSVDLDKLPSVIRDFERFKAASRAEGKVPLGKPSESAAGKPSESVQHSVESCAAVPEVPFEMLTALELRKEHWAAIAASMTWTQTRMNLNTLLRKGVFEDERMVELVASRLKNPEAIRRAKVFPYQLLAAYKAAGAEMPRAITLALQDALEVATKNVPTLRVLQKAPHAHAQGEVSTLRDAAVYVCPDVSGSMHSPVTGGRGTATSAVQCIDVAALVAASFLRSNARAEVLPFSDDVVPLPRPLNPRDSVMTNAQYLASLPSGGTACAAPLRWLNRKNAKADIVIFVSDNQSWADFKLQPAKGVTRSTVMAEEWALFRMRNPQAKLVLIDVQPYAHTQVEDRADVLNIGGFSDVVFELVALFAQGGLAAKHFAEAVSSMTL